MSEDNSKKRLGRGLAALIGEMDEPGEAVPSHGESKPAFRADRFVPIEKIRRNPNNPRRDFEDSDLTELARSIGDHGIVQPILVRPVTDTGEALFEIIAGERRWRAAQRAEFHEVPVVVRNVDDRQALELAIIENVQRADLNPIEEGSGYQKLMDEHGYTQLELSETIGKSRSHVANTLRLLRLPEPVQKLLASGDLSPGHARALITLEAPERLAKRVVSEGLSVRETEKLVAEPADKSDGVQPPRAGKSADTVDLEKRLSDHLGLKVTINHKGNDSGKLTVSYRNLDQLDGIAQHLARPLANA